MFQGLVKVISYLNSLESFEELATEIINWY